jgi:hypothetical protein
MNFEFLFLILPIYIASKKRAAPNITYAHSCYCSQYNSTTAGIFFPPVAFAPIFFTLTFIDMFWVLGGM